MVECPNCGEEIKEGLKVCLNCGYELPEDEDEDDDDIEVPVRDHTFRNTIIALVILIILGYLIYCFVPLAPDNSLNTTSRLVDEPLSDNSLNDWENTSVLKSEPSTKNESVDESSDNSLNDWENISVLKSEPSTKNVKFGNVFTMDTDADFEKSNSGAKSEIMWHSIGNSSENGTVTTVYYWLKDTNYTFRNLEDYNDGELDGELLIYTSKYKKEGKPKSNDYMVFVGNDKEVVAIEGADLDSLKKSARSVKFLK